MKLVLLLLLGIAVPLIAQNKPMPADRCEPETFAATDYANGPILDAPNGHLRLHLSSPELQAVKRHYFVEVITGEHQLKSIEIDEVGARTMIQWSEDGKAFYILWSSGTAAGPYHVRVFWVDGDEVHESQAPSHVAEEFLAKHQCSGHENSLFAIQWVHDSDDLVFEAAVPNAPECRDRGMREGFIANIHTGQVLRRMSHQEVLNMYPGCVFEESSEAK